MARSLGFPGYQYVAVPHPIASRTQAEIDVIARDFLPEIVRVLGAGLTIRPAASREVWVTDEPPVIDDAPLADPAEVRRAMEFYSSRGWTDGLPVVPVTDSYLS